MLFILIGILLFSFLILIHELGHFITAKLSGVQVNEFALFMGPKIFSKTIGETTYRLNWIPFGGYCAMEGEDGDSDNPRAFTNAKVWKRVIILCAGSFMNLLAGFLIVLFLTLGTHDAIPAPIITDLEPQSDLVAAGLEVGDRILEIDGNTLYIRDDLSLLLSRNTSGVFDFKVERGGEELEFLQVPVARKDFYGTGELLFGISYGGTEDMTFGNLMAYSWNNCRYFSRMVWISLGDLITGRASINDVSGPAGIMGIVSEAGEQAGSTSAGMLNVLYLFAFIAVNLAVMNMLPIPALDGGRVASLLIVTLIEKIFRKKLNPKYEGYVHAAGMVILLAFMAFITVKDVIGFF